MACIQKNGVFSDLSRFHQFWTKNYSTSRAPSILFYVGLMFSVFASDAKAFSMPSNLVTTGSQADFRITFSCPNSTHYCYLQENSGGEWNNIHYELGQDTVRKDLTRGIGYHRFRIHSCTVTGTRFGTSSSCSNGATRGVNIARAPRTSPAVKVNESSKVVSLGTFDITWSRPNYSTHVYLHKKGPNDTTFRKIENSFNGVTAGQERRTVTDDGVYFYRVEACNQSTCAPLGEYVEVTVVSRPGVVSNVTAKPSELNDRSISFGWIRPSGNISYYESEVIRDGTTLATRADNSIPASNTTWEREVTQPGFYQFRIRACNDVSGIVRCASSWSSSSMLVEKPQPPESLTSPSVNYSGSYSLQWEKQDNTRTYTLEELRPGSDNWRDVEPTRSSETTLGVSASGSGTHKYRVIAHNDVGDSIPSGEVSTDVVLKPSKPAISGYPQSPTNGIFTISWNGYSDPNAQRYKLVQLAPNGAETVAYEGGSKSGRISVSAAGDYTYHLQACNDFNGHENCSAVSNSISVAAQEPARKPNFTSHNESKAEDFPVSWDSPDNLYSFTLQYRKISDDDWTKVDTTNTYYDVEEAKNGQYEFQVKACNRIDCTDYTDPFFVTVALPPSLPDSISMSGQVYDGVFDVSWSESTGHTVEYNLEQRRNSGEWEPVSLDRTDDTDVSIDVTDSGTYRYRVSACNTVSGLDNCLSNWRESSTIEVGTPSSAPSFDPPSAATTTNGAYALHWSTPGRADRYELEHKAPGSSDWVPVSLDNEEINSHQLENLGMGKHEFRVEACNRLGCNESSDQKDIYAVDQPETIEEFNASGDGAGNVQLSWNAIQSESQYTYYQLQYKAYYQLQYKEDNDSFKPVEGYDGEGTSATFSGLSDSIYRFQVRACNRVENSTASCSPEWNMEPPPVYKPDGEIVLSVPSPVSQSEYDVSWSYQSSRPGEEATWFELVRNPDFSSNTVTRSDSPFEETADASGHYDYRVRACNQFGCSSYSNTETAVVAITPSTPSWAEPPSSSDGQNSLSWTAGNQYTDYYLIEESGPGGGTEYEVEGQTHFTKTVEEPGSYEYQVKACARTDGHTSCSTPTPIKSVDATAPEVVSGISLPNVFETGSDYALSWEISEGATYYKVTESVDGSTGETWEVTETFSISNRSSERRVAYEVSACNSLDCSTTVSSEDLQLINRPEQPGQLEGPNPNDGTYELWWLESTDGVIKYAVTIQAVNSQWEKVDETSSNAYELEDLDIGEYTHAVSACREVGGRHLCSEERVSQSYTTDVPENAPGFFTSPELNYTGSISLTWDPVDNIRSYQLEERYPPESDDWRMVYETEDPWATLEPREEGEYEFRVTACNNLGCSAASLPTETSVFLTPQSPEDLAAEPDYTSGQSQLYWTNPEGEPSATMYEVGLKQHDGSWAQKEVFDTAGANEWPHSVTEETTRVYGVRACREANDQLYCSDWTESAPVEYRKPSSSQLNLPFVSDNGIFTVLWAESEIATEYQLTENLAEITTTATSVAYLSDNAKSMGLYTYIVEACNVIGCSQPSHPRTIVVSGFTLVLPENSDDESEGDDEESDGEGGDASDGSSGGSDGSGDSSDYGADVRESGDLSLAPGASAAGQPVGAISGDFRVDESGAATYSISLALPRGTAGVDPDLSLNYSSQGGTGSLGKGWSLGGLSAISRCRQTLSQDGQAKGIHWDERDRFCLEGQRLMVVSGDYGAPGSEYRTELDQYKRITAQGGSTGHPDYFTVESKDGSTATYGGTTGSKVAAGNNTYQWSISRFSDSVGNQIVYDYENNGGNNQRIEAIRYAFPSVNSTSGDQAKVEFEYNTDDRSADSIRYVGGYAIKQKGLLDNIRVTNGSSEVRRYELSYEPANTEESPRLLSEIALCSGQRCLPATDFQWTHADWPTPNYERAGLNIGNTVAYQLLDINGNGRRDIVWLEDVGPASAGEATVLELGYAIAGETGLFSKQELPSGQNWAVLNDDVDRVTLTALDYNADGREDVLVHVPGSKGAVYLSEPDKSGNWGFNYRAQVNGYEHTPFDLDLESVYFGDLTSNGLVDAYTITDGELEVFLLSESSAGDDIVPYRFLESDTYSLPTDEVGQCREEHENQGGWTIERVGADGQIADFNGNGRADLIVTASTENEVPRGGRSNSGTMTVRCVANLAYVFSGESYEFYGMIDNDGSMVGATSVLDNYNPEVLVADINADGIADVIVDGFVRLNNGSGFRTTQTLDLGEDQEGGAPQVSDVNGNGYLDLVFYEYSQNRVMARSWNAVNERFEGSEFLFRPSDHVTRTFVPVDLNSSGTTDLLEFRDGGDVIAHYSKLSPDEPSAVIKSIDNGIGNVISIDYGSILGEGNYTSTWGVNTTGTTTEHCYRTPYNNQEVCRDHTTYTTDIDEFYEQIRNPFDYLADEGVDADVPEQAPVVEPTIPLHVVTGVGRTAPKAGSSPGSVDSGHTNYMSYAYHHLRIQAAGRGSLGFERLSRIDHQTGITEETVYRQDWPFIGSPLRTTRTTESGKLLGEASNDWTFNREQTTSGNYYYQTYIEESSEIQYEPEQNGDQQGDVLKQVVSQINSQDEFGNIEKMKTVTSTDKEVLTTLVTNDYGSTAEGAFLGRLKESVVTKSNDSGAEDIRSTSYTYHQNGRHRNLLLTETLAVGTDSELTKKHHYDEWGNTTHQEILGSGSASRVGEQSIYENGRYLLRTENAKGHITKEVLARNAFGSPTEVVDIHGNLTQIRYDSFGREYQRQDDTGGWTWSGRRFCSDGIDCPQGAVYRVENRVSGGGRSYTYYDALQRTVREATVSFDGNLSLTDTEYDEHGRAVRVSTPYLEGGVPAGWTQSRYDLQGRLKELVDPSGQTGQSIEYDGYKQTITNAANHQKVEIRNVNGELTKVVDELGGEVRYQYDMNNNLLKATSDAPDSSPVEIRMCYDAQDRKIAMHDPDKGGFSGGSNLECSDIGSEDAPEGWWRYRYNAFGEMEEQVDAKGQKTEYEYDTLGRKIVQTNHFAANDPNGNSGIERSIRWHYDENISGTTDPGELGQLTYVVQSEGEKADTCEDGNFCEIYAYDRYGRGIGEFTFHPNGEVAHMTSTEYDAIGRAYVVKDIAHLDSGVHYRYNNYGYRTRTLDLETGDQIHKTVSMDARGQVTEEERADNGVITTIYDYDPFFGRLLRQTSHGASTTHPIQDLEYDWDQLGNLEYRKNQGALDNQNRRDLVESFCYDALNRLEGVSRNQSGAGCSGGDQRIEYDGLGNITYKYDVGAYTYGGGNSTEAGPRAVLTAGSASYQYDGNGNQISGDGRTLKYTTFDKPHHIEKGDHTTQFRYGPNDSRYQRTDQNGDSAIKTTYYFGNVERIEEEGDANITWRRTVAGRIYTFETDRGYNRSGETSAKVLFEDYLGSVDVITDTVGGIEQSMSFDPWGQRRNTEDWGAIIEGQALANFDTNLTQRGYTGHEQMDEVGLIHMGGRVYDPKTARFLQADPYIQSPEHTQSYNRYSYVWNNPLNANDPSGYFLDKVWDEIKPVAGAIAVIAVNVGCGGCMAAPLAGMLGGAVGAAANGGNIIQGAVFGAFSGFAYKAGGALGSGLWGGTQAHIQGGSFGRGFAAAGIGAYAGGMATESQASSFVLASLAGGVTSEITGGKFKNGAATAAFTWALSQGAQKIQATDKPDIDGSDKVAFVGGAADNTFGAGVVKEQYEAYKASHGEDSAQYFEWTQRKALSTYVEDNQGRVTVVAHSYGADEAAHLVANGMQVHKLVTVDPVGWTRPNMQAVANNTVTWNNYVSTGSVWGSWDNVVATIGGAWNSLPSNYATSHTPSNLDHVAICQIYCRP